MQTLNKVVNNYIRLDPKMPKRLEAFDGKVVEVFFKNTSFRFYIEFRKQELYFSRYFDGAVDTLLIGSPCALAEMGLQREHPLKLLFEGEVEICGDVELGQDLKALFDDLEIDWGRYLSRFMGDATARQVVDAAHSSADWGKKKLDGLQQDFRQSPDQDELDDFFSDVDQIRMDSDRFEAHFNRVLKKLG